MAEVYWIRLPEHTDMLSEGYIGVTKRTAQYRFYEHVHKSKDSNSYLHNVIRKYGKDKVIVETLVICDIDYAFDVEKKLRPDKCIGWNLAAGGYNSGVGRNKAQTTEHKKKRGDALRGIPFSEEHKTNLALSRKKYFEENPRPIGVSSTTNHAVWSVADKLFECFHAGYTTRQMCEKFSFPSPSNLTQIRKYFNEGWNPLNDAEWLKRYKGEDCGWTRTL